MRAADILESEGWMVRCAKVRTHFDVIQCVRHKISFIHTRFFFQPSPRLKFGREGREGRGGEGDSQDENKGKQGMEMRNKKGDSIKERKVS